MDLGFKHWLAEAVVYHGTPEPLAGFNPKKQQSGYYPGFYTTSDPERARSHGGLIYSFQIEEDRYFAVTRDNAEKLKQDAKLAGFWVNMGSGTGEARYLASLGYHGIRRGDEYIVFSPEKHLK